MVIAGLAAVSDPGLVVLGTGLLSLLAAAFPWDGELARADRGLVREIAARRILLMTELRACINSYVKLTADIARERDDIQRRLSENFEILMRGQRSPWWSRKRKSSRPG